MTSSCHSIESLDGLDKQDISGHPLSKHCHSIESLHTLDEAISSQQSSVLEGINADSDDDITVLKRVNKATESMGEMEELTLENSEEVGLESSEEDADDYDFVKPEDIEGPTPADAGLTGSTLPVSKSDGHVHQAQTNQNHVVMDSMAGSLTRSNLSGAQYLQKQDSSEDQKLTLAMPSQADHPVIHSPSCPEISESMRHSSYQRRFTPQYTKECHRRFSPLQVFRKLPIIKNPYMSPYLAPDEMLKCLPPIKLVVS